MGVGFPPEAKVAHYFSGSAGSKAVDARKLYYCHRNLLRTILKDRSQGCALSFGAQTMGYTTSGGQALAVGNCIGLASQALRMIFQLHAYWLMISIWLFVAWITASTIKYGVLVAAGLAGQIWVEQL